MSPYRDNAYISPKPVSIPTIKLEFTIAFYILIAMYVGMILLSIR